MLAPFNEKIDTSPCTGPYLGAKCNSAVVPRVFSQIHLQGLSPRCVYRQAYSMRCGVLGAFCRSLSCRSCQVTPAQPELQAASCSRGNPVCFLGILVSSQRQTVEKLNEKGTPRKWCCGRWLSRVTRPSQKSILRKTAQWHRHVWAHAK